MLTDCDVALIMTRKIKHMMFVIQYDTYANITIDSDTFSSPIKCKLQIPRT